jgi:SAM-dependent methyltransferase
MVQETLADIQRAGWQQVTMQQMDAEHLDFPAAAFDRVLCSFAIQFFPQPPRALHEFFRVLRPGGRVGLMTWTADCPFLRWCHRELTASLPSHPPPAVDSQEVPRFDTTARIEVALQQAGFVDIDIHMEEAEFIYTQDEDWWVWLWSIATRRWLERLEAPVLAQVKADMLHKVQVWKRADSIHAPFHALCSVGTKPGP